MKLAIMQPYLFPYFGYFQLIHAVDRFVIYDDVNFIKQGWISRNNILVNGQRHLFTVPVEQVSSFQSIRETKVSERLFPQWYRKFEKTVDMSYRHAPYYEQASVLIREVFGSVVPGTDMSELCYRSISQVCRYLGITTEIIRSSSAYGNAGLKGEERVIDICRIEGATQYINAPGGKELYHRDAFAANAVELSFIHPGPFTYNQGREEFVPYLSIIDALMYVSPEAIKQSLNQYTLE